VKDVQVSGAARQAKPVAAPLPLQAEALTAAWFTSVLGPAHPGTVVESAQVVDIITGTSTKIRVALQCNEAGRAHGLPTTVIVKGGFEAHSVHLGFMYAAEMRFYRDLLPRMPMNAPRCWFAASDPGSHQSVVVMEDLAPRGVRFCRVQQAHSYAEAEAFLAAMARWHAAWWDHPALADDGELGWVGQTFDEFGWLYANRYLHPPVWEQSMQAPRGQAVATVLRDGERMRSALRALEASRAAALRTLVHGDSHPGNLYIEREGRPGFLDAQVRRAPWVQDVAYHLAASLDLLDRPQWEEALLAHYLRCLATCGVANPPSFQQAWDAYRDELVYGLFIFLINETAFQTEATNTACAARFGAAVAQHRSMERLVGA
jgi:hypothetical protein